MSEEVRKELDRVKAYYEKVKAHGRPPGVRLSTIDKEASSAA